jgi:peptidoglycan/LPS O-acetylase OafA/YrhL
VPRQRTDFITVQALRAIAALLVVAFHGVDAWSTRVLGQPADIVWPNGAAGVDIFFVISGLVMVISANGLADKQAPWRIFLRQRIIRIVPLYWIMTTVKVVAVLAVPALVMRTRLDLPYVVGSYLFLPVKDAMGSMFPVLPVGWTLTYEMLFYLMVVMALALRRPIYLVATPLLAVFALVGIAGGLGGFANTIVIEFLFGVLIGTAIGYRKQVPFWAAASLLGLGFAALLTVPVVTGVLRPITWGLPAAFIVAGAVALEEPLSAVIPRSLRNAGDASYSIYLMHPFIVPIVFLVVARLTPATLWLPVTICASLLASIAIGRIGFMGIERPLLRWFRRPTGAPAVVVAG